MESITFEAIKKIQFTFPFIRSFPFITKFKQSQPIKIFVAAIWIKKLRTKNIAYSQLHLKKNLSIIESRMIKFTFKT